MPRRKEVFERKKRRGPVGFRSDTDEQGPEAGDHGNKARVEGKQRDQKQGSSCSRNNRKDVGLQNENLLSALRVAGITSLAIIHISCNALVLIIHPCFVVLMTAQAGEFSIIAGQMTIGAISAGMFP